MNGGHVKFLFGGPTYCHCGVGVAVCLQTSAAEVA